MISEARERASVTIVYFVASCKGCPFNTRDIKQAHSHSLSERHTLAVTKHYRMEPK